MKFRATFEATDYAITSDSDLTTAQSAVAMARAVKSVWEKYVEKGEIITIEFNDKTRTAKVVPAKRRR